MSGDQEYTEERKGMLASRLRAAQIAQEDRSYDRALECYHRVLELAQHIGDKRVESCALQNLGLLYSQRKNTPLAVELYQRSIVISREIRDSREEGVTLRYLGILLTAEEQLDRAISLLTRAAEICVREVPAIAALSLGNLAWVYAQKRELSAAFQCLEKGEALLSGISPEYAIFRCVKAKIFQLANRSAAEHYLIEAQKIALHLGVQRDSELLQAIKDAEDFLATHKEAQKKLSKKDEADLREEAEILLEEGELEEAEESYGWALYFYQQSLDIYKMLGDLEGVIQACLREGKLLEHLSNSEKALEKFAHALELTTETKRLPLRARTLEAIAFLSLGSSDYTGAIAAYQEALTIVRGLGDSSFEAKLLGNLGSVYQKLRQEEQAEAEYLQALRIVKKNQNRGAEAEYLYRLGILYRGLEKDEQARDSLEKALTLAQELEDTLLERSILGHLGGMYERMGDNEKALSFFSESIALTREIAQIKFERHKIGSIYQQLWREKEKGSGQNVLASYHKLVSIFRVIGNKYLEGRHLGYLGKIYQEQKEPAEARKCYERALRLAREIDDQRLMEIQFRSLGGLYHQQGDSDRAVFYLQRALSMARSSNNYRAEARGLGLLGEVFSERAAVKKAQDYLSASIEICREVLSMEAGAFLGSLAVLQAQEGSEQEAIMSLSEGEELVSENPYEYAKFLCKKAEVFYLLKHDTESRKVLLQVKQLEADIAMETSSELTRIIQRTEALVSHKHAQDS